MRSVIGSFVIIGLFSSAAAAASQAGATGKPPIKACSLLSKDLVMKVSGAVNKAVFELPPDEEPAGKSGSLCSFADIILQIDPFSQSFIDDMAKKEKTWVPVSGVGDRAWFHDNKGRFAELIGYAGGHTFTIQMGVPFQSTTEKMKPNVITLANAIVPKLK